MGNIALVFDGGGGKGVFSAGVLNSLIRKLGVPKLCKSIEYDQSAKSYVQVAKSIKIFEPALVITCSASIFLGPPLLTGRYDEMSNIIEEDFIGKQKFSNLLDYFKNNDFGLAEFKSLVYNLFTQRDIISPKRILKMIDLDMAINVFEKRGFFDEENLNKVFASPIHYIIPALNVETAEVEYFCNRDQRFLTKPTELFGKGGKAGMNLVFGAGIGPFWKPVRIGDSYFEDSPDSAYGKWHLPEIIERNMKFDLGIEKILFVHNDLRKGEDEFDREKTIYGACTIARGKDFKKAYRENERKAKNYWKYEVPNLWKKGISIYTVRPSESHLTTLGDDGESVMKTFNAGDNIFETDKGLGRFLGDY